MTICWYVSLCWLSYSAVWTVNGGADGSPPYILYVMYITKSRKPSPFLVTKLQEGPRYLGGLPSVSSLTVHTAIHVSCENDYVIVLFLSTQNGKEKIKILFPLSGKSIDLVHCYNQGNLFRGIDNCLGAARSLVHLIPMVFI